MRVYSLPTMLTVINLVLLGWLLATGREAVARPDVAPLLRASAIELVDDNDVVRAQLIASVEGETLLRLRDAKGEVRVKLEASEEGSGLLLADQSTEPGLQILAKRGATTLSLTDTDGTKRVIRATDP